MSDKPLAIAVRVFRFDPGQQAEGWFQNYEIESTEPLSVMALLSRIHNQEPAFACRTSTCFKGTCGSCLVRVNGKDVFGCTTLIAPGEAVVIEPHSRFKRIRDVVVDFSQPQSLAKEASANEHS